MELVEQALERARICREDEYADGLTRGEYLALAAEVERLRRIEQAVRDAKRGNAAESDDYENGWIDAATQILNGGA